MKHLLIKMPFTLQLGYPPLRDIVKLGARRGKEEYWKQFNESSLWSCAFVNRLVDPELPIFVNTTLPYGKIAKEKKVFGLNVYFCTCSVVEVNP